MVVPLILAGAAVAGVALQAYGMFSSSQTASQMAVHNQRIVGLEKKAEAQRKQQMDLQGRRDLLQNVRMAQRARALALANATSQGAGQGSGLQGGYGQIRGQETTNALGIYQNLQIGRSMFDINQQIGSERSEIARLGANLSQHQAVQQFGSSIVSSLPAIKGLSGGFGPGTNQPNWAKEGGYGYY